MIHAVTARLLFLSKYQLSRSLATSCQIFQKKALILGVYSNKDSTASDEKKTDVGDAPIEGTSSFEKYSSQTNGKLKSLLKLTNPIKPGTAKVYYGVDDQYSAVSVVSLGMKNPELNPNEGLDVNQENIRKGMAAGLKSLKDTGIESVDVDPTNHPKAAAEGVFLSSWSYKKSDRDKMPASISMMEGDPSTEWNEGRILAEGQNFARYLMDSPANLMNPTIFAETVKEKMESCDTNGQIEVLIHDEEWVRNQNMGAFLSVSQGSSTPLKFLEIKYRGPNTGSDQDRPLVLVGKGVTFDSGGVSIKPSQGMEEMRADMGGAATVASSILTAAALNSPCNLIGLIPLCENMINGQATRPGDVVTAKDGSTIQVDNTDAEGRLLLADALVYSREFNPSAILDVATLTGAMMVALGAGATGVFTNSDRLWTKLNEAGSSTGDRVWRMPLYQLYSDQVKPAHLADINNVGKGGRGGGACTAAAFLNHFVQKETSWAHLDIAGVMDNGKGEVPYLGPGMAGRPTRTLTEFIRNFKN